MTKEIKVLVSAPNPNDATSFYRAWGPFHEMAKKYPVTFIPAVDLSTKNWADLSGFDAVFLQRPWTNQQRDFARFVKKVGLPLWIDYDDDPFQVPKTFFGHQAYHTPETTSAIKECLKLADLVSVTTNKLAATMGPMARGMVITIPNAFMNSFCGELNSRIQIRRRKIILWRGTAHHRDNLNHFADEIVDFANAHPEFIFVFMGELDPWFLTNRMPEGSFLKIPEMGMFDYFYSLFKMSAWCQIVTLCDNDFNRSKSNIAFLEGAGIAGSPVIAPDFEEWANLPGVINYSNKDDFRKKLEFITTMAEPKVEELGAKGKQFAQKIRSVERINMLRLEVLAHLVPQKLQMEPPKGVQKLAVLPNLPSPKSQEHLPS
jgi:hypothetical protein